jgi:prepilin-type N-terminal cleavage/methylation domain-containing protein
MMLFPTIQVGQVADLPIKSQACWQRARRAAFTLLEMVLALAIGVLLLTGLYFALDLHLKATTSGRSQVDQAQVARSVLKNIQTDFKDHLATLDAYPSAKAAAAAASGTTTTMANPTTSAAMTYTLPSGATTTSFPFNLGLQGDDSYCTIYISKLPRAVVDAQQTDPTMAGGASMQAEDSDLRRITYWLNTAGDTKGLARQEIKVVTSEDTSVTNLPPAGVDDMTKIVAPEVVAIHFEYFDGTSWQATWDGTQPGTDGITPIGPPVAIAITISVARSDNLNASPDDPGVRQYRHVIQIPTASYYSNWPNNTVNPAATPQSSTGTTGTTGG